MAKVWKIVLIAVLVLLVGGVLLAGAGFLTGASPERVWNALGIQARFDAAFAAFNNAVNGIL